MEEKLIAVLICNQRAAFKSLESALAELGMETLRARTLEGARRLIQQVQPHLIFSDTSLPDGTWADVVRLARKAQVAPNVIVISSDIDLDLYHSALHSGAYDFLFPPFVRPAIGYLVQSAADDVLHRKRMGFNASPAC